MITETLGVEKFVYYSEKKACKYEEREDDNYQVLGFEEELSKIISYDLNY